MEPWQDQLLDTLLLGMLSLAAGAAIMIVHGLLVYYRLRSSQSLTECVELRAVALGVAAGLLTLLLLTQASVVPWERLRTLALLVATAPLLQAWFGPPKEHVESSNLCQIGKGFAYNHYYGYLRLMQGVNEVRMRLEFFRDNQQTTNRQQSRLSADELREFYRDAVVVLAPTNGVYPSNGDLTKLRGVSRKRAEVPNFKCTVGGNKRSYGQFGVYEVTGSGGPRQRKLVALDTVSALDTLLKLRDHSPAKLSKSDHENQMEDMIDELEKIVANSGHLQGQLTVVRYNPREHVGDAIMTAIELAVD